MNAADITILKASIFLDMAQTVETTLKENILDFSKDLNDKLSSVSALWKVRTCCIACHIKTMIRCNWTCL